MQHLDWVRLRTPNDRNGNAKIVFMRVADTGRVYFLDTDNVPYGDSYAITVIITPSQMKESKMIAARQANLRNNCEIIANLFGDCG